jgi:hypothetical protein
VALALLGWVPLDTSPAPGLDPSWGGALHMAAHGDLAWGRDVAFTYGPLGFLKVPVYWYGDTGALAIAYTFLSRVALLGLLWHLARRSFGSLGAALILLVIGPLVTEPVLPLAAAWGLWLLHEPRNDRAAATFAVGIGALGALELLAKLNGGVTILAVGVLTLAFLPARRGRGLAVLAGSAAAGLLVGWLGTGQPLGALDDFAVSALRVVSGYASAMQLDRPELVWQYTAAAIVFGLGLFALWSTTELQAGRTRIGSLAVWTALSFLTFKSGFVRHDGHEVIFFATLLAVLTAVAWTPTRRFLGLAVVAAAFIPLLAATDQRVDELVAPSPRVRSAWKQVGGALVPGRRLAALRRGRARIIAADAIDPRALALIGRAPVHVAPSETAVIWAYGLNWRPLPSLQGYQAYTKALDRQDARALTGGDAPRRVLLRAEVGVDGRIPAFDTPEVTRELLCRYSPLDAHPASQWLVLGRRADRCGAERPIATVSARWGQSVRVPRASRPGALVVARVVGADVGGLERLRSALYKAHERFVILNGSEVHRLAPGTVGDGLVLSAPPAADYPPPFQQASRSATVAVGRGGHPSGRLRFEFSEIPIRAG